MNKSEAIKELESLLIFERHHKKVHPSNRSPQLKKMASLVLAIRSLKYDRECCGHHKHLSEYCKKCQPIYDYRFHSSRQG